MSMPDDRKLLAIERIFDCRCATPAALPARAPTMHSRVRMPHPGADLDDKDAVDMENGRITEEEMRTNIDYLVLGHFKRKEGDAKGTHTMLWLALADFATTRPCPTRRSTLSWTPGRCRAREFATRLGGYSVRVQLRRDECEIGARWTIRGFPGFLGFQDSQDSW